ncbi:MAG: glycogen/starch synthase [Rhabdochlamydiaceae bacterium]|nr:glycogen/starch synthase [Candidatus Amphrikana amoebophyrae]
MKIIQICTEFAPIAKVGGLADVVYGLTKELVETGVEVEVYLPKYSFINSLPSNEIKTYKFKFGNRTHLITSLSVDFKGIKVNLVDSSTPLFHRTSPYSKTPQTDIDSFLFFCRATLEILATKKETILLHLHDWPTAIIPQLLKTHFPNLARGSLLTIHNLEFQGICTKKDLAQIDILPTKEMADIEQPLKFNMLKSGIQLCSKLTTVSNSYANEIQTSQYGWWLQDVIKENNYKLHGIVNGLDSLYWNPLVDKYLHTPFSPHMPTSELLQAKHHNKRALQKQLGFPISHKPLIISVTRLTSQKGPDLILHAMKLAKKLDYQFVLLGSESTPKMKMMFDKLEKQDNIFIDYTYNEPLAHLCFGSADAILIPSIFEPCGLTQLIAMRYGTIPIARKTGGLQDTISDLETGFLFNDPDEAAIDWVMHRAMNYFSNYPESWEKIARNGLKIDSSWKLPAQQYTALYQEIILS